MDIFRGLLPYTQVIRPHWTIASTLAASLGVLTAWHQGHDNHLLALLTVFSTFLAHAFMETWDELKDFENYRSEVHHAGHAPPTLFSGGSGVLTGRLTTAASLRRFLHILVGVYVMVVAVLVSQAGPAILLIIALGLFFIFAYNAGPRLSYRGWGELANAVSFGPVIMVFAYEVMVLGDLRSSGARSDGLFAPLPSELVLTSGIVGLLWFGSLHVQEMLDSEEDEAGGKRTLVVRYGKVYASRVPVVTAVAMLALGISLAVVHPIFTLAVPALALHAAECARFALCWDNQEYFLRKMKNFFIYRNFFLICISLIISYVTRMAAGGGGVGDALFWGMVVVACGLPAALWIVRNAHLGTNDQRKKNT